MTEGAIEKIAEMQHTIDVYEMQITLLAGMCQNKRDVPILEYNLPASPWVSVIYEFVREHIGETQRIELNGKDHGLNDAFKKWYDRHKKRDGESLT